MTYILKVVMKRKTSAQKQHGQSLKRRERNKSAKSRIRNLIRSFEHTVSQSDVQKAEELLKSTITLLDKAEQKGIYHTNTAARKKVRLSKKFRTLTRV